MQDDKKWSERARCAVPVSQHSEEPLQSHDKARVCDDSNRDRTFRCVSLPPEILAEIFCYAASVVDTDVTNGIWQLGRVCSYWRSVVLSSPSLWSTVNISKPLPIERPARIVEEVLLRSRNAPLSITFVPGRRMNREQMSRVIHLITAASHRWRTVCLRNIPESHLSQFSGLQGHVPMLTELDYEAPGSPEWLAGTQSLRKLRICVPKRLGVRFCRIRRSATSVPTRSITAENLITLPISLSQLRECDVTPISLQQEVALLRASPNLEKYTIRSRDTVMSIPSQLIRISKLHTLTFPSRSNSTILPQLVLPSLRCLYLVRGDGFKAFDPDIVLPFADLVSRSSCSLTELIISDAEANWELLPQFITQVPLHNLTTLSVACNATTLFATLIKALTIELGVTFVFLPRLKNLHLRPCYLQHYYQVQNMDLVIEMARSRWHLSDEQAKTVTRLAFLRFATTNPWARPAPSNFRGTLRPLLALRDEGLAVDIDRFYVYGDEAGDGNDDYVEGEEL